MTMPLLNVTVGDEWEEVTGAAGDMAGVTWQCLGDPVLIAFTTTAPEDDEARFVLARLDAYYDKNGSSNIWARALNGTAALSAMAD